MESLFLIIPVGSAATFMALAIWTGDRKRRIIAGAPVCKDCAHALYLTERYDWLEYGIRNRWDEGYYCALSEYKTASAGPMVSGNDQKRLLKCEVMREGRCGIRARLFEAKAEAGQ